MSSPTSQLLQSPNFLNSLEISQFLLGHILHVHSLDVTNGELEKHFGHINVVLNGDLLLIQ